MSAPNNPSDQKIIEHKIIILDDDVFPEGRITKYLLPQLEKQGLRQHVIHYETFAALRKDFDTNKLAKDNLFVLDSSLTKEPDNHLKDFSQTLPWFLDRVNKKNLMPASGGVIGAENNAMFHQLYERRGWMLGINQMALAVSGLSGNPEQITESIFSYFKELYPAIKLEKEFPSACEGCINFWKNNQNYGEIKT